MEVKTLKSIYLQANKIWPEQPNFKKWVDRNTFL